MLFERKSQLKFGISFVSLFVGAFVSMSAFAAKESNLVGEAIKRAWKAPASQSTSITHMLKTGCIGDSLTNCAVWTNGKEGDVSYNYGTEKDEGTILMMVAREINAHGAKFCPTQIQAANRDQTISWWWLWCRTTQTGAGWTEYYEPSSTSGCVWLCQDGYYGTGCESTTTNTCSGTKLSPDNYLEHKRVTAANNVNIEDKIPMFYMNQTENSQEFDTILAVTRFLSSGNGAFVAPVTVKAQLYATESHYNGGAGTCLAATYASTPYLSAGTETLVCTNGYKPNANKTDCVLTNKETCEKSEAIKKATNTACPGFSGYNAKIHIKDVKMDKGCYEFSCAGGKAFASDTSRECVECTGEVGRFGVVEETGVCKKCASGTVFDGNAKAAGYCPKAKEYAPTILEYGKNGSSGDKIASQCWTFTDLDLYKECVENGSASAINKLNAKRTAAKASTDAGRSALRRIRR